MADPPPITYTPQFQPPTWQDNVDLVWFEGPNGFDAQFKSLRAELDTLSRVIKTLSDTITGVSQTLSAQITSVSQTANDAKAMNSVIQAVRWGDIGQDGTVLAGSKNFTVTKAGTGLYDITFTPAFTSIPAIQATQIWAWTPAGVVPAIMPTGTITAPGGMTTDNAVVIGITMSQCRIKTGSGGGDASDRSFSFMAYGPSA